MTILKKSLKILFILLNTLALSIVFISLFLLYFFIFEIKFSFLSKKIESLTQNKVKLESINLKWSTSLKKPIIVLNNMRYNNQDIQVNFTNLGIGLNIKSLIFKKQIILENIEIGGIDLNIDLKRDKQKIINSNTKNIEINNTSINPETNNSFFLQKLIENYQRYNLKIEPKITNREKLALKDNKDNKANKFNQESFVNYLLKNKYKIYDAIYHFNNTYQELRDLKTIIITDSSINLQLPNKSYILTLSELSLVFKKDYIHSKLYLNLDTQKEKSSIVTELNLYQNYKIVINNKVNNIFLKEIIDIFNNYNFNNFNAQSDSFLKNIKIKDSKINSNLQFIYHLKNGIEVLKGNFNITDGKIGIKNILNNYLKVKNIDNNIYFNNEKIDIESNFYFNSSEIEIIPLEVNTNINSISSKISINLKDKRLDIKDLSIVIDNDNIFKSTVNIENFYQNPKFHIELEINNLTKDDIIHYWGNAILKDIKNYLNKNIAKANFTKNTLIIDFIFQNSNLILNKLEGKSFVSDLDMVYVEGLPNVVAKSTVLSYSQNDLIIEYQDGITGNLTSPKGTIYIKDGDPKKVGYQSLLGINIDGYGIYKDALNFISNQPLNLVNDELKSLDISSNLVSNIKLEYDFNLSKVKNIKITAQLKDLVFNNILETIGIEKGFLDLSITDDSLSLEGYGYYQDNKLFYSYVNNFITKTLSSNEEDNNNYFKSKYNITLENLDIQTVKSLSFFPEILKDFISGKTSFKVEGITNFNQKENITVKGDLKDIVIDLPQYNYKKTLKENGDFNISVNLNNKLLDTLNITLNNPNISGDINLSFSNSQVSSYKITNFNLNNIVKNLNLIFKTVNQNTKYELKVIDVNADYLDLTGYFKYIRDVNKVSSNQPIKDSIQKNTDNENPITVNLNRLDIKQEFEKNFWQYDYDININVAKLSNKGIILDNLGLTYIISEGRIKELLFKGYFSENLSLIKLQNKNSIVINIDNLGNLLKLFSISEIISGGNLYGVSQFSYNEAGDFIHKGNLNLDSFVLGFVNFNNSNITYKGLNYNYDSILQVNGTLMGASLIAKINFNDYSVYGTGTIIPIQLANVLLSKIPILSDLFNLAKPEKNNQGILQIPLTVTGKLYDINYKFSRDKKISQEQKTESLIDKINKQEQPPQEKEQLQEQPPETQEQKTDTTAPKQQESTN
jgi:hypothetical protein